MAKKGKCENIGICSLANREQIQVITDDSLPFQCMECKDDLKEVPDDNPPPPPLQWKKILIIAGFVAVLGGAGFGVYKIFTGEKPKIIVTIDPANPTVTVNDTIRLTAKTDQEDAKLTWTWASEDKSIATVSRSGVVSGIASGNVIITVTAEKNKNISTKTEVSVVPEIKVSIEPVSSTVMVGETVTLTVQTDQKDPARKIEWNWSSSEDSIAKVQDGVVIGVAEGEVLIFVKDEMNRLSDSASVTVLKKGVPPPPIRGTIRVPGGSYTGELKNGQPHGMGTIRYDSRTLIDSRDIKKRYAEAGQYISGEFYNGRLVQGKLFDSGNNHLETIVIGRAN